MINFILGNTMDKERSFCDLHTHSDYSDGTATPAEIVEEAERIGLAAVALTDHNCVDGLLEFMKAAEGKQVEAILGVEFSTWYEEIERELHIVALYVDPVHFDAIKELVRKPHEAKERSNLDLIEALDGVGIKLDYEEMKQKTKNGRINRAHFAAEMAELGYVSSRSEAFSKYLDPSLGLYHPPKRLSAFEAIAFIKSIGAVAVLAHPLMHLNLNELRRFLPEAKKFGLDAIETVYSEFSPVQTEQAIAAAQEFDMLQSGGSDFHGDNKPHISLGIGVRNLQVPADFAEKLKERSRNV